VCELSRDPALERWAKWLTFSFSQLLETESHTCFCGEHWLGTADVNWGGGRFRRELEAQLMSTACTTITCRVLASWLGCCKRNFIVCHLFHCNLTAPSVKWDKYSLGNEKRLVTTITKRLQQSLDVRDWLRPLKQSRTSEFTFCTINLIGSKHH